MTETPDTPTPPAASIVISTSRAPITVSAVGKAGEGERRIRLQFGPCDVFFDVDDSEAIVSGIIRAAVDVRIGLMTPPEPQSLDAHRASRA